MRDFLHVSDLVRGCLLLLERHAVADPVNIGYGKPISIKEIVSIILKTIGHLDTVIQFDATKPTTIPVRMVDTSKAQRLLGFEPEILLESGLRDTIEWYRTTTCNRADSAVAN